MQHFICLLFSLLQFANMSVFLKEMFVGFFCVFCLFLSFFPILVALYLFI